MLTDALQAKIDAGDVPPNLRTGTAIQGCRLCKHWDGGSAECLLHGFPTRATEVCDDFEGVTDQMSRDGMEA